MESSTINLTGRSFFTSPPLLEAGRNILSTHTRKCRCEAIRSCLKLPTIRGFYALARRRNIDAQSFAPPRHRYWHIEFEIACNLFPELTNPYVNWAHNLPHVYTSAYVLR